MKALRLKSWSLLTANQRVQPTTTCLTGCESPRTRSFVSTPDGRTYALEPNLDPQQRGLVVSRKALPVYCDCGHASLLLSTATTSRPHLRRPTYVDHTSVPSSPSSSYSGPLVDFFLGFGGGLGGTFLPSVLLPDCCCCGCCWLRTWLLSVDSSATFVGHSAAPSGAALSRGLLVSIFGVLRCIVP